MSLIGLLLTIVIVGVIVWACVRYIPMPVAIQRVLIVVAVIGLVIYALRAFGIPLA